MWRMVRCVVQQGPARSQGGPASLRTGLAIPGSHTLLFGQALAVRLVCVFWVKGWKVLIVGDGLPVRCVVQQGPARPQGGPASLRTGLAIRGSHTLLFGQALTARLAGVRVLGKGGEELVVRRMVRCVVQQGPARPQGGPASLRTGLAIRGSHTLLFGQALTGRLAGVRVLGERRSGRHLLPVSAWLAQHNPTRSLSDDPWRRAEPRR